jgi:hypothetical protein
MSTTHIVRYMAATVTSSNKQGASSSVTVATDFQGTTASVTVRSGDVVAETVNAQSDQNGYPLLWTLSLWQVGAPGRPWSLLPKPKVGDLVFQVGEGTGSLNGLGGVVTEAGFLRFDTSVSTMIASVADLYSQLAALDGRVTTLEGA